MFEKGNKLAGSRKGVKNRLTNDVRQCFHKAYDAMGDEDKDENGKPLDGDQAFQKWAKDNQTEFYRLYGKLIPATVELPDDLHEDFIDTLIFEEEQGELIEATDVVDVEKAGRKQLPSAAPPPDDGQPDDHDLV